MHFGNYRLQKTWLHKCLKSLVLEDPSTSNMLNGLKRSWNLLDSAFIIFIYHNSDVII